MKHWRIPPWEQVKVTQQVEGIGSNRILEVAQLRKGVMDSLTGDSLTQNHTVVYFSHTLSLCTCTGCHRLKVDENAPSLPSRSLKRLRGRGAAVGSKEEGNSIISHRGRGGSRRREKEGKAIKADLVTKRTSRFRPRTQAGSNLFSRQRANNKLSVVSGKSEQPIEPEKALRAEKLKKSR